MTCTTDCPFYLQSDLVEYFNGPNPGQPPYPRPLPNDDDAREKLLSLQPFQVFSCWNGAAVINPLASVQGSQELNLSVNGIPRTNDAVRFRMANSDGDQQVTGKASECYLICVDLWLRGLGRILLVPRASIAYNLAEYELVRQDGGRTITHPIGIDGVHSRAHPSSRIIWGDDSPPQISYHDWAQWYAPEPWGPWDEP